MIIFIRRLLPFIMLAVVSILAKKKIFFNTRKKYFISLIVGYLVLSFPYEQLASYDSPESAFKYAYKGNIIEIVEQENSALIIYEDDAYSSVLLNKKGDKWKIPLWSNKGFSINLPDIKCHTRATLEDNSDNFYIDIRLYEEVKSISDNYNSHFKLYEKNDWITAYVAYVDNFNGDYVITINGIQYEIPAVEDER